MINIVYIHGFMSAGRGGKYEALKRRYRKGFNITSPSFNDSVVEAELELNVQVDLGVLFVLVLKNQCLAIIIGLNWMWIWESNP